ncbi:MAG: hypothetical protein F6K54_32775 [Okeania sp. SIO3B5]|uniref:hypothetical protein n=1 Tax=Okeania sp. SIO3B5 TaxID=2607811 RepID=UPI0013FEE83A|nr:hypothetical protein [Okeania sp. SIO3B5]NEO57432.1 hypothetical protein [Okeania sp. SIO3B5]
MFNSVTVKTRGNYPLSIIHYPLSIIHYPLSIIHYPLMNADSSGRQIRDYGARLLDDLAKNISARDTRP